MKTWAEMSEREVLAHELFMRLIGFESGGCCEDSLSTQEIERISDEWAEALLAALRAKGVEV